MVFPPLREITTEQAKDTGQATVLLALLASYFGHLPQLVVWAGVLLVINMTRPRCFRPVAVVWLGLSHLLGTVLSKLILTVLFYAVVTPIGLLRRACGADSLQLKKWKQGRNSVFVVRDRTFRPEDLEHPY
jgi:hypothetical protein